MNKQEHDDFMMKARLFEQILENKIMIDKLDKRINKLEKSSQSGHNDNEVEK